MDEEKLKTTESDGDKRNNAPETSAIEKKIAELSAALEAAKKKKVLPEEVKAPLWKRIMSAVIWVVLCLLFAALLLITLTAAMAKARGDRAEIFGCSIYIVVTGSMEPNIKVGDFIITKKTDKELIKVDDVITFQQGDKIITHRVESITANGFITKGDANNVADGEIPYTQVYGKVIYKSTLIGAIFQFASSQYGFLGVIVVPLFLFVIYESWALGKKFKALKGASDDDDDGEDIKNGDGQAEEQDAGENQADAGVKDSKETKK